MKTPKMGFAVMAGLVLVLAACGGSATTDTTEPVTTAANDTQQATTAPPATEADQTTTTAAAFSPERPECIAPADPGGGWDFTCRSIGQVLTGIGAVDGPVQVTNMGGGGGGVALGAVVAGRNEDNSLIIAASPATTLRLAQGVLEQIDHTDFRWIGAIGADFGVIAVAADSEFQTVEDLISAWQGDPRSVAVGGGSAVGGQDHMKVLLLAEATGIVPTEVKYVPFDGGGEAMTSMLGGFIDVFPGDISEVIGQYEAGEVRILAALSPERLDLIPDIPTVSELGYEMEWIVWRGLLGPGGMTDEAYDYWVDALGAVEASEEWQKIRDDSGIAPLRLLGDDFADFVSEQVDDFAALSESLGLGN